MSLKEVFLFGEDMLCWHGKVAFGLEDTWLLPHQYHGTRYCILPVLVPV